MYSSLNCRRGGITKVCCSTFWENYTEWRNSNTFVVWGFANDPQNTWSGWQLFQAVVLFLTSLGRPVHLANKASCSRVRSEMELGSCASPSPSLYREGKAKHPGLPCCRYGTDVGYMEEGNNLNRSCREVRVRPDFLQSRSVACSWAVLPSPKSFLTATLQIVSCELTLDKLDFVPCLTILQYII